MTKKQQRLLGLYRELDQICREKKVEYTLAGTTAAGAILAGGFLKGDETLNLYVTAKGWDVLRQLSGAELPSERAFLGTDLDANDTSVVKRYAAVDTCAVHRSNLSENGPAAEGIYLIVLDALPAGEEALESYRKTLLLYAEVADPVTIYGEGWELPAADYKKALSACKSRGRAKTLGELEEALAANRDGACPRLISRLPQSPLVFERRVIFPAREQTFEGISAPVPGRTWAYMTQLYGMEWGSLASYGQELAPEEISPVGIRPEDFREEYLSGIRVNRLVREQKKQKLHTLSQAAALHHAREKALVEEATPVLERLNERIRQGTNLTALTDAGDYSALGELLKDYLHLQTSAEYIGRKYLSDWYFYEHPIVLEVSEEIFRAAAYTLLHTGRAGEALRILSIKKESSTLPLAPDLEKMRADLLRYELLIEDYDDRANQNAGKQTDSAAGGENAEEENAGEVIDGLLAAWPKVPEFLQLKAKLLMNRARQNYGTVEMAAFLRDVRELYPQDGCFLKYEGELLWIRGKCADALDLFEKAREKTDDRRIWREIETLLEAYGSETAKTCRRLIDGGQKAAACQMAEQWAKLLPENLEIRSVLFYARVSAARTVKEMDALVKEMTEKMEEAANTLSADSGENLQIYRLALNRAWERLGFPQEAAEIETDILRTRDADALEMLAVKARDSLIHKDRLAEVYKVIGDAHRKQGQTTQAMEDYQKAMDSPGKSYVKSQLLEILEARKQAETKVLAFEEDTELFSPAETADGAGTGMGAKEPDHGKPAKSACRYEEECWDYVRFCGERIALEQFYLSQKEYLVNLNRNQDISGLIQLLEPYHRTTLRSLKRQEIFVPDEEIFRIYLEILEKTGKKALKEKIERYW